MLTTHLKDLPDLYNRYDGPIPQAPHTPSMFHAVRDARHLARTWLRAYRKSLAAGIANSEALERFQSNYAFYRQCMKFQHAAGE